jgi:replicative DNA helicase
MEAANELYEQLVLLYMLKNPRAMLPLKEQDFFSPDNRLIFKHIKKGINNPVMLVERLKKDGKENAIKIVSEELPEGFAPEPFVNEIIKMAGYRETLEILHNAEENPEQYGISEIRKAILKIRSYSKAKTIKELFNDETIDSWTNRKILTTGFPKLDEAFHFSQGQFLIIAGETSKGKTQMAMNIAKKAAEDGCKVLFISLEMTAELLLGRFVAMTLDYPIAHAFSGNAEFRAYAKQFVKTIKWIDNILIDETSKELVDVLGSINEAQPDLVIVDYAQLMSVDGKMGDEKIVAEIAQTFRSSCHDTRVILVSQLSRATEATSKNPLSRLKGSGALEYSASAILFVSRREKDGVTEYELAKNTTALGNSVGMVVQLSNANGRLAEIE